MAVALNDMQRMNMDSMNQMFSKMFQSQQQQIEAHQKQNQDFLLHLAASGGGHIGTITFVPDVTPNAQLLTRKGGNTSFVESC
eukprot:31180-Ditylum_brightwellii.AAC.1